MSATLELPLDIEVAPEPSPAATFARNFSTDTPPPAASSVYAPPPPAAQWLLEDVYAPAYRPLIPDKNVWQWADDFNVFLDGKATLRPGYYNSARTPHVREFNETLTDPAWKEDLVIKCSRSGFTEAALNNIRYSPRHAPGHALFAIDSKFEAKNISKDRLEKTLADAAGEEFPEDPDDNGIYTKFLRNMTVYMSGSYSPGIFRNKWLRTVYLDECEVKSEIDDEGSTFDLAESRINRHPDGKLFAMSKPKKPGTPFHKRWCTGTRSVRLVPCVHCGTFQELTMFGESATENLKPLVEPGETAPAEEHAKPQPLGRLVFDHCKELATGRWDLARVRAETYYQCVGGCKITGRELLTEAEHAWIFTGDHPIRHAGAIEVRRRLAAGERLPAKQAMMLAGQWLQTNPHPHPKRRSRHISDLYCLDDEIEWGVLATMFLDCKGDPAKLLHFYNNNLGFVFRQDTAALTTDLVLELRDPRYKRGTCPFVPDLVTLSFDTQAMHYVVVIMAWRLNGTGALVDWFHSLGDTDIHHRFAREIPVVPTIPVFGEPIADPTPTVRPQFGLGDAAGKSGRTDDVYDLCLSLPGRCFPSFGRGSLQLTTPIAESRVKHRMQDLPIYKFSDENFKTALYKERIGRIKEIKKAQAEEKDLELFNLPPRLYLPGDVDGTVVGELTGDKPKANGGWEEVGPNHFGDAIKNGLVLFEFLLPRLRATKIARDAERQRAARKAA